MPKILGTKDSREERAQASAPYPSERLGAIASMLQNGEGDVLLSPNDVEARTAKDHQQSVEETDINFDEKPSFNALTASEINGGKIEYRRVSIPPNRFTPLKENWAQIYEPIVKHMKLQIRMNLKTRNVELRTSEHTENVASLQKAADFVKAFVMGFEVQDAIALLRLDDLYVDTFEVRDVKPLQGDHLSRAIGRIAGKVRPARRSGCRRACSECREVGDTSKSKSQRGGVVTACQFRRARPNSPSRTLRAPASSSPTGARPSLA